MACSSPAPPTASLYTSNDVAAARGTTDFAAAPQRPQKTSVTAANVFPHYIPNSDSARDKVENQQNGSLMPFLPILFIY